MSADYAAGYEAALQAMCRHDCGYCAVDSPAIRDDAKGASPIWVHRWTDGSTRTCWATRVRSLMEGKAQPAIAPPA